MLPEIRNSARIEFLRPIARGGMAEVWLGNQLGVEGFHKQVAIKLILADVAKKRGFVDDFIGEAKLVADLVHTNIVQTYQLDESDGRPYIVMEYVRGVNLDAFCDQLEEKGGKLPLELAVFIVSRVARALAYAHGKRAPSGELLGIVHRDVSFSNVMISFEGDVKLTDFGIAKAVGFLKDDEGRVMAGKPDYMSPEQADYQKTDGRSDLFSMGVVLAQLLLGHNIFNAPSAMWARKRIRTLKIPDFRKIDPRIGDELNRILHRLLERDLAKRYQSAGEALHDLEFLLYGEGYGPTNETLGEFTNQLFGQLRPDSIVASKGDTVLLARASDFTTRD